MIRHRLIGPVRASAAALIVLAVALHAPVFTRGALITPAGMHYAQWPWKAQASAAVASGAMLQENHTLSDLLFQVYPWQVHMTRTLASGSVPLWNPYSDCGAPFLANAQSALFYPLHWPAWIIPSLRVFTIALLLKILLAGVSMAVFLRGLGLSSVPCVIGSVSFALCGFMTSWLGYAHTNAAALLPLLMHAARLLARSPGAGPLLLMALAGAAQYLGGHPETSLHMMAAASLYFVWSLRGASRKGIAAGWFASACLMALLMSSVQLLPFVAYLRGSAALASRQALAGMDPSLPAESLLALLLPYHFGRPWDFSYRGPTAFQAIAVYAGAGVLLLALTSLRPRWARQAVFFQASAAVAGLIVYGPHWVRGALRPIPLVGISSNNRLLLVISFSIAVLAALALERMLSEAGSEGGERWKRIAWLVGALAILAPSILVESRTDPHAARLAGSIAAATALLAGLAVVRPTRRPIYLLGLVALTCLDMLLFAWRFNPHADPDRLFPRTALTDFLRKDVSADMTRGGRLLTIGWTMRPETHTVYRLPSIEGYDAIELAGYRRLLDRAQVASIHDTGDVPAASRPLLNLMSLRYFVTPPGGVVSGEAMRLAYDGPDGRVFVNEQAMPRFSIVGDRVVEPPGGAKALDVVASASFDPRRAVVLEAEAGQGDTGGARAREQSEGEPPEAAAISVEKNADGAIALRVAGMPRPGYLLVTDAWAPGWEAAIDGRPAAVLRADHIFRAVRLPGGDATITMTYRPGSFTAGAWISVLSLLAWISIALTWRGSAARHGRP